MLLGFAHSNICELINNLGISVNFQTMAIKGDLFIRFLSLFFGQMVKGSMGLRCSNCSAFAWSRCKRHGYLYRVQRTGRLGFR